LCLGCLPVPEGEDELGLVEIAGAAGFDPTLMASVEFVVVVVIIICSILEA